MHTVGARWAPQSSWKFGCYFILAKWPLANSNKLSPRSSRQSWMANSHNTLPIIAMARPAVFAPRSLRQVWMENSQNALRISQDATSWGSLRKKRTSEFWSSAAQSNSENKSFKFNLKILTQNPRIDSYWKASNSCRNLGSPAMHCLASFPVLKNNYVRKTWGTHSLVSAPEYLQVERVFNASHRK